VLVAQPGRVGSSVTALIVIAPVLALY
jgi:hypothetical protein